MELVMQNNKENLIDGLLIGMILSLEVCYSKAIVLIIPFLLVRYIYLGKIKTEKLLINRTTMWLFLIMVLTTVFGLRLDDNNAQFSVVYNLHSQKRDEVFTS